MRHLEDDELLSLYTPTTPLECELARRLSCALGWEEECERCEAQIGELSDRLETLKGVAKAVVDSRGSSSLLIDDLGDVLLNIK